MDRCVSRLWVLALAASAFAAEPAGRIHGVLRDHGGAPIAGAEIRLLGSDRAAVSDPRGRFELASIPAGSYVVAVELDEYTPLWQAVELAPGAELLLELTLLPRWHERITVTATRARERQTPAAFSNLSREQIERLYTVQDVPALLDELPGAISYSDSGNNVGYTYLRLRGFDSSRIGVKLNGIPLNDPESHQVFWIDLPDFLATAQDIQVQRGVATSSYGLSALAGSVDVVTRRPPPRPELELDLGAGSYSTRKLSLTAASGTIGSWSLLGRLSYLDSDGYRDQSWSNLWAYFGSAEWKGEHSTLRLNAYGGVEETHLAFLGVPRAFLRGELSGDPDRDRRFNPLTFSGEIDHFSQPHFELHHEFRPPSGLELDHTLYWTGGNGFFDQFVADAELVDFRLEPFTSPNGMTISRTDLTRRRGIAEYQTGWIPRLAIPHPGGTLTLGGELRFHRGHHTGELLWIGAAPPGTAADHRYYDYTNEKWVTSLYANELLRLGERTYALLELQYSRRAYDQIENPIGGILIEQPYHFWMPRAGLNFNATAALNLYVNYGVARREPGFRDLYNPQDIFELPNYEFIDLERQIFRDPRVRDERAAVWEAGFAWRRPSWELNANAYRMDFEDEIVFGGTLNDLGEPVVGNADRSVHQGLELNGRWRPGRRWTLEGNLSVSDDHFIDFTEFDFSGPALNRDGNRIPLFPAAMGNLRLSYQWGPAWISARLRLVGQQYLDASQDQRKDPEARQAPDYAPKLLDPYSSVDAIVRVTLDDWLGDAGRGLEAYAQVSNVFDARFETFGYLDFEPVFIPAAARNLFFGLRYRM